MGQNVNQSIGRLGTVNDKTIGVLYDKCTGSTDCSC